jgi:hypothetical protein
MSYQVIDRNGRLIEVEDDQPVPEGCSLQIPAVFMDGREREVIDDLHRRHPVTDQDDDGEHCDDDPGSIRADAYYDFRARIDTANNNRRHRIPKAPKSVDPSWVETTPWRPRGRYGNDEAPLEAEERRAAAYYEYRNRIHTAGRNRGAPSSSPPADAAASERRQNLERLQRAYARGGDDRA